MPLRKASRQASRQANFRTGQLARMILVDYMPYELPVKSAASQLSGSDG